jgi:hypothetical protein
VAAAPHCFWHRAAERTIHHADFMVVCVLIAKLAQTIVAP